MRFKFWELVLSGKKLDDLDTNYELNNAHISHDGERFSKTLEEGVLLLERRPIT
jgi:hypothetical protein